MSIICPPNQEIGCIVGIDPGTNFLGFSTLHVHLPSREIVRWDARSFRSEQMIDSDTFVPITHNERIAKIIAQRDNLLSWFRHIQPFVITCENPFINRLRPAAYGPLVEILFAIRTAAIDYNPAVKFITYEPSIVKKTVGAGAICGKDEMRLVILKTQELIDRAVMNYHELDEHAIDASAVAYTHLLKYRKET